MREWGMPRIRRDVARSGGGWTDELEWYARAVRELRAEPADVRTGWRYLGAIHGFDDRQWRGLGILADGDVLPSGAEQNRVWNQCQHQGWYFLPWHRGYLWAFEAIVAAKVEELGGPNEWALPYWNYFDETVADPRAVPAAFLDPSMPDGSPNPLSDVPRSGVERLGPVPWYPADIDLDAMRVRFFTSAARAQGFGGGPTVFNQFGGQTGALEGEPHNSVHVMLGGPSGYMADPGLAGLDPIFWLHHCNIDRLWAAWLTRDGNLQEGRAPWMHGPAPRGFQVPDAGGGLVRFTPEDTLPDGPLAPLYDDLVIGTARGNLPAGADDGMNARLTSDAPPASDLIGANARLLAIGAAPVATTVEIVQGGAETAAAPMERRVFLSLENVRGSTPSGVLEVRVGLRSRGAVPAAAPEPVRTVALFGLARASSTDDDHGGNGITVSVDVTDLVRRLGHEAGSPLEEIEVHLGQPGAAADAAPITVERVSLYTQAVA
jgi:tyrosinase